MNVLLADKSVQVHSTGTTSADDNGNYKVLLSRVDREGGVIEQKRALGMMDDASQPLKVAVSGESLDTLKDKIPTKLVNIAIKETVSQAKKAA